MPKPPNPHLIGCLTLLAAHSTAILEPVYAASDALPSGEPQADSGSCNNAESSESLESGAAINAQTITPDNDSQPAFAVRGSCPGVTIPDNDVDNGAVSINTSNNNLSDKLKRLQANSTRDASANSNLLATRNALSTATPEVEAAVVNTAIANTVTDSETHKKHHPVVSENGVNNNETATNIAIAATDSSLVEEQSIDAMDAAQREISVVAEQKEDNSADIIVDIAVISAAQSGDDVQISEHAAVEPAQLETSDGSGLEANAIEIAQLPIEPPLKKPNSDETDTIIDELLQETEAAESRPYRASPAVTISNPSGFGADNRTGFVGAGYQSRTRFGNSQDGAAVVGVGLGNARENIGVQLSYTAASFGGSRDFGAGGFNAKVHRRLADDWSVALGWEGFITTADVVDFEDSIYGSVSHIIRTRESITEPFSRVALTAGVGSGRFRTEDDVFRDRDSIGVFGSVAVRVAEPVSAIVEWTGQDLAAGLSITPFRDVPLVLVPAVRDITGAGDGGRFVLGTGFSFQF